MRTIVHLSDLHFGAIDERLIDPLQKAIAGAEPDLVAVSGDLTQRARPSQFREARAFLDALGRPTLVVPGNHDMPLFDVPRRVLAPLARFRRYITSNLTPVFLDDEMVVVGLNSARALSFRHGPGRLNRQQVLRAASQLQEAGDVVVKIVVTHHPFDLPVGHHRRHLIGRAHMAMASLASAGADVFLAGHLHVAHIGHTAERYRIEGHSALVVQAGTLSHRERGERGSFNLLRVGRDTIEVTRFAWHDGERGFHPQRPERFERARAGWRALNFRQD